MYQIALCDDEVEELDKSESILKSYREQHTVYDFSIERFEDVNELLRMVREKEYVPDLLFMDIYMPDKQGIEAAKELREMGSKCRLVFLTTSMDHALDAFRVEASQYLVKPIHKKKMFPLLDKLLGEIEKEQKTKVSSSMISPSVYPRIPKRIKAYSTSSEATFSQSILS